MLARAANRATDTNGTPSLARAALWTSLAIGAALRIWLVFNDDGIYWPDEVYQSLEPAHRLAFGYGLIAWEWVEGHRNWTLPGLIAALFELCQWAGFGEPRIYLAVVRLVLVALSLGCAGGAFLLARVSGARRSTAAVGASLGLLFAPSIYFSHRALAEVACSLPAVLGFALAVDPGSTRRRTILGASLLGLSVLLRLQCGIFALVLIGILVGRRAHRQAFDAVLTLGIWAFALGFLDHLTWGTVPGARLDGWFHSSWKYFHFNAIEGQGSGWGTSPWPYYFTTLFWSAPVLMGVAAILAILAVRRAPGLACAAALFIGLHALVAHKELRFILPVLPFFWSLAAIGLDALAVRARSVVSAALLAAALVSAVRFHTLTFGDLGHEPDRASESAYDNGGPVNRLMLRVRRERLLCGLAIYGPPIVWTGGASYLHRRVPIYPYDQSYLDRGWVNYLIAPADRNLPGRVVAQDGGWVLRDLSLFPCTRQSPPFSWRL